MLTKAISLLGALVVGAGLVEAAETGKLLSPIEAARAATLPKDFALTLFAGEPDVTQPVAMTFDDRGRLWVVECHTYADLKTNFDTNLYDRIVIFEDTDGDGRFDRRKVFWDRGQRVTSVAVGFGGVWVLCAPQMVFIPDRNGDDVPDGPPEVLLDGWDAGPVRHNIVNGLKWGPDGWLYGRHGIQTTSSVGPPGARDSERTRLNCCIWRYHPIRRKFEVVCQGGTNSWGHDWDDYGELFFINTVIGHLWHGFPGGYFKRMYGEHLAPHRYELIDQHADHYHWDSGKSWTDSRNAGAGADALGGGHAHSGLMIYLGHAWAAEYHNALFTLNFHGQRINQDRLEFQGSGYVGKHAPDFVKFADPWFRGVDLAYGPDGNVFILDWSDTGECHENDADGVHRETGRIFKLRYIGSNINPLPMPPLAAPWNARTLRTRSLQTATDAELVALQGHPNEWFVRQARRILQERAANGRHLEAAASTLREQFKAAASVPQKLRALWALNAIGAATPEWLRAQLSHPSPQVRIWAIRLLADTVPWEADLARALATLAKTEASANVRLALASALQQMPVTEREPLAIALLAHGEDNQDHNLPLMLWYGIEAVAGSDAPAALRLAAASKLSAPRHYLARRLTENLGQAPAPVNELVMLAAHNGAEVQADILLGMSEALRGWRKAPKPAAWDGLMQQITAQSPAELQRRARELSVVFGDGRALAELRGLALSGQADAQARADALRQLIEARPPDLQPVLERLVADAATAGVAVRGLAAFDDPDIPELVIKNFPKLAAADRAAAVGLLAARPHYAAALLEAVAKGRIPRLLVNAYHARQIQSYGREALTRRLKEVWGEIRVTDAAKQEMLARYKQALAPANLKTADLSRGREVFAQVCAVCHTLYGEGAKIGPDLTGSGRANLDYLLENILDPSAVVPADFKAANVYLKDDRELSAVVLEQSERTITLQTPTERLTLDKAEVVKIQPTEVSLMPEGLLEALTEAQAHNLIAYLMHTNQVKLP